MQFVPIILFPKWDESGNLVFYLCMYIVVNCGPPSIGYISITLVNFSCPPYILLFLIDMLLGYPKKTRLPFWTLETSRSQKFTYIKIFGASTTPHLLPRYVPNRIVPRKITYQTMVHGIASFLSTHAKIYWLKFMIKLGLFTLTNFPHANKEDMLSKNWILV